MTNFFKSLLSGLKKTGHAIGKFQTKLLSSFLYYFLVTPIGLIFQAVNLLKNPLAAKPDTYWISRDPKKDLEDVYKQF